MPYGLDNSVFIPRTKEDDYCVIGYQANYYLVKDPTIKCRMTTKIQFEHINVAIEDKNKPTITFEIEKFIDAKYSGMWKKMEKERYERMKFQDLVPYDILLTLEE